MSTTYHPNNQPIQEYSSVYNIIVNEMISYMKSSGLKAFILGISGGIDSTVVAVLAHMACKKTNGELKLIGVSMPSVTNQSSEVSTADKVMKAFCDEYHTMDIQDMYADMCKHINKKSEDLEHKTLLTDHSIAAGNIKARLRMMYLYHMAASYRGLVLDTDNLSEYYLGFYTRSGDQFDYSPISGLWKGEVYGLARYFCGWKKFTDEQRDAIESSIGLQPTDGNGCAGQGSNDMDQIAPGCTYRDVDAILQALLDTTADALGLETSPQYRIFRTYEALNELDYDTVNSEFEADDVQDEINVEYEYETVKQVCMRHFNSEFKRAGHPIRLDRSKYTESE